MIRIRSIEGLRLSVGADKVVEIQIFWNKIYYCEGFYQQVEKEFKKELSWLEINEFIRTLNELEVTSWKKEYDNLTVLDGLQWELMMFYNSNRMKRVWGSNYFPGSKDFSPHYSTVFVKFLSAFEKLLLNPSSETQIRLLHQ